MSIPRHPQGLPLVVLLSLAACGSEPSSTPPPGPPADVPPSPADLGALDAPAAPCGGACGPGTVCEGGRCLPLDAGPVADVADVSPGLDMAAVDVLEDRAEVAAVTDVPAPPPDVCVCSYPNARAKCSPSGACSLVGCLPGFADCDGRNVNGCETDTNEAANCGACNNRCPSGSQCTAGRCERACPSSGETWCFDRCVNLAAGSGFPSMHCGACGVACMSGLMCSAGRCVNPCPSGRLYCQSNTDLAVACVDVQTSNDHCGTCRGSCAAPLRCSGGMCVR